MTTRPIAIRFALVFAALGVIGAALAGPAVAYTRSVFPMQSANDRGEDVRALQYLLRAAGQAVPVTRVFDAATVAAITTYQSANGLPVTGRADAPTWAGLAAGLRYGSSGDAVRALQVELRAKRAASIPVSGTFMYDTQLAVAAFQRHAGLRPTGEVDAATWRDLAWHYAYPDFTPGAFCDYDTLNRWRGNWATASSIAHTQAIAASFSRLGFGAAALGDASLEHGGAIPGHETHRVGLDVDLRPIRRDRAQCAHGTNFRAATYDRIGTRALLRTVRATATGHVKLIYFNDPVLIREGLSVAYPGHDDHIHIRYCEPQNLDPLYSC